MVVVRVGVKQASPCFWEMSRGRLEQEFMMESVASKRRDSAQMVEVTNITTLCIVGG